MKKNIFSFKEALAYMDASESFLYKLTSQKAIRFSKPNGGRIYFRKEDLDDFMLSNEQKSKAEIEEETLIKIRENGKK